MLGAFLAVFVDPGPDRRQQVRVAEMVDDQRERAEQFRTEHSALITDVAGALLVSSSLADA